MPRNAGCFLLEVGRVPLPRLLFDDGPGQAAGPDRFRAAALWLCPAGGGRGGCSDEEGVNDEETEAVISSKWRLATLGDIV